MTFILHDQGPKKVAELQAEGCVVRNARDGKDLMANAYHQGADALVVEVGHLDGAFFDLSTKLAGEILQAFSNYNMKLAVIGNFSEMGSESLQAFIRESNRIGRVLFLSDKNMAIARLASA